MRKKDGNLDFEDDFDQNDESVVHDSSRICLGILVASEEMGFTKPSLWFTLATADSIENGVSNEIGFFFLFFSSLRITLYFVFGLVFLNSLASYLGFRCSSDYETIEI